MRGQGYRGDIQLYRAVAVLYVLLFHLGAPGFSAGFLGVDIFFVISGYLMTTLYTQNSTALDFYLRRARRLLPAYFAAVIATLLAAAVITVPSDFAQVRDQTLFAATLTSNIGFFLQNSYFSKTEFNPLLHLWSLGVECQFYLLFPLLIVLTRRFGWFLPLMLVGSLLLCLAGVLVSPKLSFFLLPMRIWEFAVGMWAASRPEPTERRPWRDRAGLGALLVMLAVPLLPIDGQARSVLVGHPALAAVVVVAATGLALLFRQPAGLIDSAPGRLGQRLGDVSYSLYLAHWPVLVLLHYAAFGGTRAPATGLLDAAVAVVLIAAATALLYGLFERPAPKLFTPVRAVAAAAAAVALALALPPLQLLRFDQVDRQTFAALTDRAVYRCGKLFRITDPDAQLCPIGEGPDGTVLLIGDSFSDALKQTFAAIAARQGFGTAFAVDNQPLITRGLDGDWLAGEVRRRGARAVFLHYSDGNLERGVVAKAQAALAGTGTPLFLILPPPTWPASVPQTLFNARRDGAPLPPQTLADYRAEVAQSLAAAPSVTTIDIAPLLCAPTCRVTDDSGRVLYFDHGHLTLTGAARLTPALEPALRGLKRPAAGSPAA